MGVVSQFSLPNGNIHYIKQGPFFVNGRQTSSTATWTGNIELDALYNGLTIAYYLPYQSPANPVLNLTFANGTTSGNKNIYEKPNTRPNHTISGQSLLLLMYRSSPEGWYFVTDTTNMADVENLVDNKIADKITETQDVAEGIRMIKFHNQRFIFGVKEFGCNFSGTSSASGWRYADTWFDIGWCYTKYLFSAVINTTDNGDIPYVIRIRGVDTNDNNIITKVHARVYAPLSSATSVTIPFYYFIMASV